MFNKTNLLIAGGALLLGYIAADTLVNYDMNGPAPGLANPFDWAFQKGAAQALKS